MKMMIPYILERLAIVNHLLTQCARGEVVPFEEADTLASFYRDFNDTTGLIMEANRLVNSDIDGLSAFAISLSSEVETYLSTDKSKFATVDFEVIFDSHIKPYEERYNTVKDISTALWREYSAMNNRLDYLPVDSEDYKTSMQNALQRKQSTTPRTQKQKACMPSGNRRKQGVSISVISRCCLWMC